MRSITADQSQSRACRYEPVFDNVMPSDGRGPDQHVAASACIAQVDVHAWMNEGTLWTFVWY